MVRNDPICFRLDGSENRVRPQQGDRDHGTTERISLIRGRGFQSVGARRNFLHGAELDQVK